MYYRFVYLLLLFGICIMTTLEWDLLFNFDDNDKLLCYSCKGNDCKEVTNNDQMKILCNKKTQLCWAGYIDQQPYRTCASRYCTPSDISLDSNIRIETCCRSDLCNLISLSESIFATPYSTSSPIEDSSTIQLNTTTKTLPDYFIGEEEEIEEESLSALTNKDSNSNEEESIQLYKLHLNTTAPWNHLSYDKDYNNGVASISSIVLFLIPLLFVLLF
ncbi:hypothetical protein I4U23_002209 [Adineta vaga]|nr:hypothetical protein I4U23_002209 [Adineta vaga]